MSMSAYFEDSSSACHRKTKIVATVGPASRDAEMIARLIRAGVNVFRLNFSHGSHKEHGETFEIIRRVSKELEIPVAILQDLCGPKIRITPIENNYVTIEDESQVILRQNKNEETSTGDCVYVNLVDPVKALEVGQSVLFADGIMELRVERIETDHVVCKVVKGGRLRSRVGIAFPESNLDLPATTEKDLVDFAWGIRKSVDYVAISFVQNAKDIKRLRSIASAQSADCKIIAKIETRAALENIDEIIDASDGIMVARGDLGVEVPLSKLPNIQKELISRANYSGVPVIVATQMLHSMVTSVRPTRAEAVDCAFAVMSGADAVMLSEETAIGKHPVEAVAYLDRIAQESEKNFTFDEYKLRLRDADRETVPDAIAYATCAAALKVGASAIVACTQTGTTARLVAKYRPQQPLYAATSSVSATRRMCLFWGVRPILCEATDTREEEINTALRKVQLVQDLPNGSLAVTLGGLSVSVPGSTSVMEVKSMHFKRD